MNATLKLNSNILAHADVADTSNPVRRYVDWTTKRSYSIRNPKAEAFVVDAGASLTLFSGVRSTGIGVATEFLLTLSPLASDRYRFAWTAIGSAPAFRTDRALTLGGDSVQIVANANLTVSMIADPGDFTAVVVGDTVFIPGVATGDAAGPFSPVNVGYWLVLSKSIDNSTLQLSRPVGASFAGVSETVAVAANSELIAFSATGVQVGDSVNVSAGFGSSILGTYSIVAVTSTWFEVIATQPLPVTATAVPGASGMLFYTAAKRFLRIEGDQAATVRLNGDTGNSLTLAPFEAGDPENTGWFEKAGICWQAVVVNQSSSPLNVLLISAE